ncbi:hypothetical protein CBM2609_B120280 [Cupriavidus taiwanensis]|uniref:Uncharacterized protein n=1 Tax=Cupriavidus taiwanensis TaxID=164546 RepID=A0A976B210_9BURK|nr:hypothetical protein CBM2604_B130279 [Cupriavidus taiwanensis]SOZ31321.1 hypothetical protein CBM2609_B120280 [Cupriavidus taiwanensis]SOZ47399.1 hypothetical protein CBM2610_B100281 [Cupriavidus taiwanensis]SOZ67219.1 hypothetical protein CBM2614_B210009 [Cupriavidus taiwanensis]SOZ68437.1 hypothetical protein CBM2615_B200009 [Cupriavidus taiwanensis]
MRDGGVLQFKEVIASVESIVHHYEFACFSVMV